MSSGPVLTRNDGLTMRTTGMLDAPTTRALAHELEVQFFAERGIDCVRHVGQAMCRGRRVHAQPLSVAILVPAPQCISAVGEPRNRPHCLMCLGYGGVSNFKITNALFRECWTRTYELQRHRYRWGWHHVKAKSYH